MNNVVLLLYERILLYNNIHSNVFKLYILMYPVLKITNMLNFLDTFSMGVTNIVVHLIIFLIHFMFKNSNFLWKNFL
jgi:hypothetical protein